MNSHEKIDLRDVKRYGKVAVLLGGNSAEREISLQTGQAVYAALCRQGVDVYELDVDEKIVEKLLEGKFDRAFIALHGRGGEDGVIQGTLKTLNISYTGSDVLGSALSMDKTRSKQIWQNQGLSTPAFIEINNEHEDLDSLIERVGLPMMVKPVQEGSSCGATKVLGREDLQESIKTALKFDDRVMAEQWIEGEEYTVSILQSEVLPTIRIKTPRQFYDFEAKYLEETTQYDCPCGLEPVMEKRIKQIALQAFAEVGASGWGRVDLILDNNGIAWLIEVNTVPGMTRHSLVPMAAKQAGITFDELVIRILDTSMSEMSIGVEL